LAGCLPFATAVGLFLGGYLFVLLLVAIMIRRNH
jgi:hypothetical protein